ncbi:hypothetical protein [Synergistes jonesii]|uniref:hypothetical protein n=1 Tax=Synergistes jonesii TaxID=2754 RepID=UPI00248F4099|nr:hypothetical protein [Synergistes jonesii]
MHKNVTNSDEAADPARSIYHRDIAIPPADSFYPAACTAINVHITSPLFEQQVETFYLLRRLGEKTFLACGKHFYYDFAGMGRMSCRLAEKFV